MSSKKQTKTGSTEPKPRNFVAESEILTQAINVENRHLRLNEEFAWNPRKCQPLATTQLAHKENWDGEQNGRTKESLQTDTLDTFNEQLRVSLKRFYDPPNQKYPYPLTTAQQIGWFVNAVSLIADGEAVCDSWNDTLLRDRIWGVLRAVEGYVAVFEQTW